MVMAMPEKDDLDRITLEASIKYKRSTKALAEALGFLENVVWPSPGARPKSTKPADMPWLAAVVVQLRAMLLLFTGFNWQGRRRRSLRMRFRLRVQAASVVAMCSTTLHAGQSTEYIRHNRKSG